jgi:sugar phosphate isomerase/epimerase
MARKVTLFTGQWADLPLAELCKMAKGFGYDGLELACLLRRARAIVMTSAVF